MYLKYEHFKTPRLAQGCEFLAVGGRGSGRRISTGRCPAVSPGSLQDQRGIGIAPLPAAGHVRYPRLVPYLAKPPVKSALYILSTGQAGCCGHPSHPSPPTQFLFGTRAVACPAQVWWDPDSSGRSTGLWCCNCELYGLLKPIGLSLALALLEVNGQQDQPLAVSQARRAVLFCSISHCGASNSCRSYQCLNSHAMLETRRGKVGAETCLSADRAGPNACRGHWGC